MPRRHPASAETRMDSDDTGTAINNEKSTPIAATRNTHALIKWRCAIRESRLPPTTRLVLLTLSTYMDSDGGSCFPSTKALEHATGLSERSVITHLHRAHDKHWLRITQRGIGGRQWKSNKYAISFPKDTKPDSVVSIKGTEPHAEGTEPHDTKALKEVQSNSSYNSTEKTHLPRERAREEVGKPAPDLQHNDNREASLGTTLLQPSKIAQSAETVTPTTGGQPALAFDDVVQAMHGCGTPLHFCTSQVSRNVIRSWQEAGTTQADLHRAISLAVRRNKGGPINPNYLNPFVRQVVTERLSLNGGHRSSKDTGHYQNRVSERMTSLFEIMAGEK